MNSKARFHLLYTRRGDFIRRYIEGVTSRKKKITSGVGEGGVAGEGRVIIERLFTDRTAFAVGTFLDTILTQSLSHSINKI